MAEAIQSTKQAKGFPVGGIPAGKGPRTIHVVPNPKGGWDVKRGGAKRAGSSHDTKREAIDSARELSRRHGAELSIHNKNGRIAANAGRGNVPYGDRHNGAPVEVPERLKPFLVRRPRSPDMLGVTQAAERLGVSRSTVYNWVRNGTLLAWKRRRGRGLTIPAGQILGPRRVVPGLAAIMDIIGSARLTWVFLTQEWPLADDVAYPLEKLKSGHVQEVLDTAPAFGTTFT